MKKLNYKNVLNSKCLMKNKGITLIALIVTIIIVLILASVSIAVLSNTGIIKKSKFAGETYQNKINEEEKAMQNYTSTMNEYSIADSGRDTVTISKEEYEIIKKKGTRVVLYNGDSKTGIGSITLSDKVNNYDEIVVLGYDSEGGVYQYVNIFKEDFDIKKKFLINFSVNKADRRLDFTFNGNICYYECPGTGQYIVKIYGIY